MYKNPYLNKKIIQVISWIKYPIQHFEQLHNQA